MHRGREERMRDTVLMAALGGALLASAWPPPAHGADGERLPILTVVERTSEPLVKADRPWEDFCLGYCKVLRVGDDWHLWYNAHDHNYRNDADCYFCYARSRDGIRWEKPALGVVEYGGKKDNNIVQIGSNVGCVFVDERAHPEQRFRAVAIRPSGGEWWVYGGASPDGVHWKWSEEPLLKRNSDTANVCFRDGELYRLYVREWTSPPYGGRRVVSYTESKTFGGFPNPARILEPDEGDPRDLHFYSSAAAKLKDGRYLMLPSGFTTGDGAVCVYAAFSRDGREFRRVGRMPLLELGRGFDSRCLYVGPGAVPGKEAGTYWFYYLGGAVPHDANQPSNVKSDGGIGRFLLRIAD
jgi:hypothetical protein